MAQSLPARIRNRLALMDTSRAVPMRLTSPVATFTFDDFPASAYDVGGKIIEECGAKATYFTSGEFMSRSVDGLDYYTAEQLKKIHANGHEIGCHSFDHKHMGERGASYARDSCARNATLMRELLGEQYMMTSFAYPYGDASLSVKRAMARQYALCRGVRHGVNTGMVNLAQIKIISLERYHWDVKKIEKIIADAHGTNSWLVFLSHDVSDVPSAYGSTPDMLKTTLHALSRSNISVMTLKAAAAHAIFGEQKTV